MSASADPQLSPEWEAARSDWWKQAEVELARLHKTLIEGQPGQIELASIYAPMHDMAGLAGVLGYPLLGKIARGLIETLRKGADPLDAQMLKVGRAYMTALVALHAKDVRGDGGTWGDAILAKLASIQPA